MQIWEQINQSAKKLIVKEPTLEQFVNKHILQQDDLANSLTSVLVSKLQTKDCAIDLASLLRERFQKHSDILEFSSKDIVAICQRDPACDCYVLPFLFYKGFHAIALARVANKLWLDNQRYTAYFLQSLSSRIFSVDIHPNVKIGYGLFLDHATSFVAGETAVIGNNVSILHEVTLGGSGKIAGDRHPKVGDGVLIGSGAKLLGNIVVGNGSKVGAGSVVMNDVPEHVTVVGVPAKIVGKPLDLNPSEAMNQYFSQ